MAPEEQALLRQIICTELGDSSLVFEADTAIRDLPGIESMKVLRIISKIERQFEVELSDEVVFNIGTYGELSAALDAARREAAP